MSTHAMFDTGGPRARRRVLIATVLSVVGLAGLAGLVYYQFYSAGQLKPSQWQTFVQPGNLAYLARALRGTAAAAAGAGAIALPLGLLLAVGRLSRLAVLRVPATAVIEFFRAVPVLLVIYVFLFALPQYGVNPSTYWKLVIPIGLCAAAVLAEVFRAGVLAVPRGQEEAGLSVGLTKGQAFRIVVFPQALRMIVPALVAQVVVVVKDTAFGWVVSYPELMQSGRVLVANTGDLVQTYLVITLIYVVINVLISAFAHYLDRVLGRARTGRRVSVLTVVERSAA